MFLFHTLLVLYVTLHLVLFLYSSSTNIRGSRTDANIY